MYGNTRQDLIGVNHYWITMNQHKNWTKKLNINIFEVTLLLYQLLIFYNLFIIYLFRQRDHKKKVSTLGRLLTIFYFIQLVDRKQTTFEVSKSWPHFKPLWSLELMMIYSKSQTHYHESLDTVSSASWWCFGLVYASLSYVSIPPNLK